MERRPAPSDAYLEAWSRVVGAYLAGDPASALRLTADMVGRFPARRAGLGHARACLLCATGRPGDALAEAREVVAAGSWWTDRKLADPDLAGLGAFEEWAALVRTMRERSRAALGAARRREAGMEVVVPAGRRPRAVVVALHMYGVTASETAGIWADPAAADLAVVVPEARLADGDGRPCWDDEQLAVADVHEAVRRAGQLAPGVPLILAGGSQGARLAGLMALGGAGPVAGGSALPGCRGFIAVAGGPAPPEVAAMVGGAARAGTAACLVVGSEDFARAPVETLHQSLTRAGIRCRLMMVPGLAHLYPPAWPQMALEAVEAVLGSG